MTLSPEENWKLQGIEQGIVGGDRMLAGKFAEFSGLRPPGTLRGDLGRAVDMLHIRLGGSRKWTIPALSVLLAVEALIATGIIIGNMWLVVAGGALAGCAVSAAVGAVLARGRRVRQPREQQVRPAFRRGSASGEAQLG